MVMPSAAAVTMHSRMVVLGITMTQFLKGATDDDAKTDFRTAQDA